MTRISAHEKFAAFYRILKGAPAVFTCWRGQAFRVAEPKYASPPYLLTGIGAFMHGGRWNVARLIPAIYFAIDALTVAAEADQEAYRRNWQLEDLKPQTRVALQFNLCQVLDLTNPENLNLLKVTSEELIGCPWRNDQNEGREALTQAIARSAFENRAEALIVHSSQRAGGLNLVYYPSNRTNGSSVEIMHPESIPLVHGLD